MPWGSVVGFVNYLVSFTTVDKDSVVFCDNVSAVYLSASPVHHCRTKHIDLDIHLSAKRCPLDNFVLFMFRPLTNWPTS